MNSIVQVIHFLEKTYSPKTADRYLLHWQEFKQYMKLQRQPITETSHDQILGYIEHLQQSNQSARQLNKILHILEKVLGHLHPSTSNPVRGLRLQEGAKPSLPEPIGEEILLQVLKEWERYTPHDRQNHLLLNLVHYQALRTRELAALEMDHLDLERGILRVPSCSRSVSRALLLQGHQLPLLQAHLEVTRPALGGQRVAMDYLFSSGGSDVYLMNWLQQLSRQCKAVFAELGHTLKNLEHWRSSRIVQLLERLPLLEVQALVGHKYASSTERYQLQGIEQLSEALRYHHPLEQKVE